MRPEKSKSIPPSSKEIETQDFYSVGGETYVEKENKNDKEAMQLLASGDAYIEPGLDETGTETITVKRKRDNKVITYTTLPDEIAELKKVYELANMPR